MRSPRNLRIPQPTSGTDHSKGPVPRFKKLDNLQDLEPKINPQPAFRRADPEGGFISVGLTEELALERIAHILSNLAVTSIDDSLTIDVSNMQSCI